MLCALSLLAALAAGDVGLRHAHAQSSQSDRQSQAQATQQPGQQSGAETTGQSDSQAGAQPDPSSDANSNLDDPPPVLPTDPPGWKPDVPSTHAPAAQTPATKATPAPSAQTAPAPVKSSDAPRPAEAVAAEAATPAAIPLPTDPRQRQVAIECADLLQMATDLKGAVDKSTKDELSIEVVRKAGEIEQYARKVRDGTGLTAGKE
jgi:hypothetical protein